MHTLKRSIAIPVHRNLVFRAVFLSLVLAAAAHAAPAPLSDRELNARLNDAEQALRAQQRSAEYWEYGWGAFYGGAMAWSAAQAGADSTRRARNTDIVQASEGLVGLADLVFRPLPALDADSVCGAEVTKSARLHCLAVSEALLKQSAERAEDPYEALPHLENAGFNLLAGLLVWRLGGAGRALSTAVPGEIIGELQLWTMPAQPIADFDSYRVKFSPLLIESTRSSMPVTGVMVSFRF